jgi:hypothetical protein
MNLTPEQQRCLFHIVEECIESSDREEGGYLDSDSDVVDRRELRDEALNMLYSQLQPFSVGDGVLFQHPRSNLWTRGRITAVYLGVVEVEAIDWHDVSGRKLWEVRPETAAALSGRYARGPVFQIQGGGWSSCFNIVSTALTLGEEQ